MSKEVKEAINRLDVLCDFGLRTILDKEQIKDIDTVLGYVKELEEEKDKLKEGLVKRIAYCNELEKDLFENCENYVVNKSKIRDKIEELESMKLLCGKVFQTIIEEKIDVLNELLEEE